MESRSFSSESNGQEMAIFDVPVNEIIFNVEKSRQIWPNEFSDELFAEQIKSRKEISKTVSEIFKNLSSPTKTIEEAIITGEISERQAIKFYDSLSLILKDKDYRRLVLYLPFETLPDSSWVPNNETLGNSLNQFESTFLDAWYSLLNTRDIRANFVDGDIIEAEARLTDPQRVIKAAHLIPWLVMRGMIEVDEIFSLINNPNPVLQRSVADTLPILDSLGLLDQKNRAELFAIKSSLPTEEISQPLYISEKRKKWLETRQIVSDRPDRNIPIINLPPLSGPFSENLQNLTAEANDIKGKLRLSDQIKGLYPVALIGGSRLKCYMDTDSDLDTYVFMDSLINEVEESKIKDQFSEYNVGIIKIENGKKLVDSKEYWAHELFNAAWIGDKTIISELQSQLIPDYFYEQNPKTRARCLEILEIDLLQYRLMHKGYAKHYPAYSDRLRGDEEIDGQSAFYDSGYRQIATKLFIDKVFIPKIMPN